MPPNLAAVFADSVAEIRARKRDQDEMVSGAQGFWSYEELTQNDAPLSPREETYKRVPPMPPYRGSGQCLRCLALAKSTALRRNSGSQAAPSRHA